MKQFEVKLSPPLAGLTVVFTLFLVFFMGFLLTLVGAPPYNPINFMWMGIIAILFFILARFAMLQPVSLELSEDKLTIVRLYGKVEIPRHKIIEVYRKKKMWLNIKVFGDAGWFGYIGLFWNKQEGLNHCYVKNLSKAVVIRTDKGYFVVSCEHPGDLIDELKKGMHVL